MPAKSEKQAKFMRAVANSPKFAKKVGVPQSVGKEFEVAEGGKTVKKYAKGGVTKELPSANQMGSLNMAKGGKVKKMATGGKTRPSGTTGPYNPLPKDKYATGGKTRPSGTIFNPLPSSKYAAGGRAARVGGSGKAAPGTPTPVRPGFKKGGKPAAKAMSKADMFGRAMTKKSADTEGRAMKFAKGGGIERKGKTSTTMVKMNRGGKMKKGC